MPEARYLRRPRRHRCPLSQRPFSSWQKTGGCENTAEDGHFRTKALGTVISEHRFSIRMFESNEVHMRRAPQASSSFSSSSPWRQSPTPHPRHRPQVPPFSLSLSESPSPPSPAREGEDAAQRPASSRVCDNDRRAEHRHSHLRLDCCRLSRLGLGRLLCMGRRKGCFEADRTVSGIGRG